MSDIEFSISQETRKLLEKAGEEAERIFGEAVREIGLEAGEEVARNLSGVTVTHDGSSFVVNVQTGNLRRSTRVDWPLEGDPLRVGVFNNAAYADAVQRGQTGAERKAALLRNAKTSKAGVRYRFVPPGFTVTENSLLRDIPPRPFLDAARDAIAPRADELLTEALERIFKAD